MNVWGAFGFVRGKMNAKRKMAKDYLRNADLHEYHRIIRLAKLTGRQQRIAHYIFRKGLMRFQIAQRIDHCEEVVRNDIAVIYDRVGSLLQYK